MLVRQAVIDFANEELLSPPDDDAQVDKEIAALLERVNRPEARDQ